MVGNGPEDKYHREAVAPDSPVNCGLKDGTYELVGPKLQGNPYGYTDHKLIRHGVEKFGIEPPRDFDKLSLWFAVNGVEGIVWHHSDGRMVKLKRTDFGFQWPVK